MFKVIPFIIALLLAEKKENYDKLEGIYTLDNPSERVVWERIRLADPSTGVIPKNIRKKELMFSKTLPVSTSICLLYTSPSPRD